ncbi:MAG: TetR/AcrR family transcriptional regulator [Inquilinaceae bacterium]
MATSTSTAEADTAVRIDRKEAILDAAETLFSGSGFDGVPMRVIAGQAGVTQALLHYHFSGKEQLFEAVFARRATELNGERLRRLAGYRQGARRPSITVEQIVEAFFRPILELGRDPSRGGVQFSRLMAMVANGADPRSRRLVHTYFDDMARAFIDALRQALPGVGLREVTWGYHFMIGTGIMTMARTGRIDELSGGLCRSDDVEDILTRMIPFISAGLRGLPKETKPPSRRRKVGA